MSTNTPASPPGPGEVIDGRYRLRSPIGQGGMGRVFLAEHTGTGAQVALKLLHVAQLGSGRALRRFELEARNAAVLTHTNTIRVFDYGVAETSSGPLPYLAMEYLKGVSLATVSEQQGPLDWRRVVAIVAQILKSLWEAHEHPRGIIHRDIKPSNVMLLDQPGVADLVKVLDFGISRALVRPSTDTRGQMGSPETMAPEQWQNRAVGPQTDLYALGCLAYHLLAGRPAFSANGLGTLALMHVSKRPPPLAEWARPDTPAALIEWVSHLLRKDPLRRPPSARVALAALARIDAEADPSAAGITRPAPTNERPTETAVELSVSEAGRSDTQHEVVEWATLHEVTASSPPPTNLQQSHTTFVGRRAELQELDRVFDGGARLVTVHGPGGTGKTRLCKEWGLERVDEFPGGVWFCDLTEAVSLEGVCVLVAAALDVPLTRGDPVAQLGRAIHARARVLLVVDNVEQVAAQAPATLSVWRDQAPEARFLVTSRERLRLAGEQLMSLGPLEVPPERGSPTAELLDNEAVALFIDRARALKDTFEVTSQSAADIAALVRRLDGLPLAIELAAGRARLMTPRRMLERLAQSFDLLKSRRRDVTDRQATLEATIDWSWRLLDDTERSALAQCSIFAGGFSLEAAEAVIDLDALPDAPWVLEVLESLCDKSLVRTWMLRDGEPRFGLYGSIQRFAAHKLAADDAPVSVDDVARRHAHHYAELGDPSFLADKGKDPTVLGSLVLEAENIWRAVNWLLDATDEPARVVSLAYEALFDLLTSKGPVALAWAVGNRVVARTDLEPSARVRVLTKHARTARDLGRLDESQELLETAKSVAGTIDDRDRAALQQTDVDVLWAAGKLDEALVQAEAAATLARGCGARRVELSARNSQAILLCVRGQLDEGIALFERTAAEAHATGYKSLEAQQLGNVAYAYLERCQAGRAQPFAKKGLALAREMREPRFEQWALFNQGRIGHLLGRVDEARQHLQAALEKAKQIGDLRLNILLRLNLLDLDLDLGRHELAAHSALEVVELARESGSGSLEAEALCRHTRWQLEMGRLTDAESQGTDSLAAAEQAGEPWISAVAHTLLGRLGWARGDLATARARFEAALAVARESRAAKLVGEVLGHLAVVRFGLGDTVASPVLLAEADTELRALTAPFQLAVLLGQRGFVLRRVGDADAAAEVLAEAQQFAERVGACEPAAVCHWLTAARS